MAARSARFIQQAAASRPEPVEEEPAVRVEVDPSLLEAERAAGAALLAGTGPTVVAVVEEQPRPVKLVNTARVLESIRARPAGPGGALRPVNAGVSQDVYDALDRYCSKHKVAKRLVVSVLLEEFLRGER